MNKTLKIISMVAVGFLVVGIGLAVLGSQIGGGFYQIPGMNNHRSPMATTESVLEPFTAVSVDSDYMDLILTPSETGEWSIATSHTLGIPPATFSLVDGTLYVSNESGNSFPVNNQRRRAVISYPSQTAFDNIDINIAAAQVEFNDFSANHMNIDLSAGNIIMTQVVSEKSNIDVKAGALEINNSTLNNFYTLLTTGDLSAEHLISKNFQANLKMGSVSIDGDLTGTIDLEAATGDIALNLMKAETEYDVDIQADLGSIEVNDLSFFRNYTSQNEGTNPLDINVNMGSIDVEFSDQ